MTLRCKKCTNLHTQLLIIMKDWFQSDRAIIKLHAQAMKFRPWHIRLSLFCYMCSYHNSITVQGIPVACLQVPQQKAARYNIGPKFHHALIKNTDYFRKILCMTNIRLHIRIKCAWLACFPVVITQEIYMHNIVLSLHSIDFLNKLLTHS